MKAIEKKKEIPTILADDGTSYGQKCMDIYRTRIESSRIRLPFLIILNSSFPSSLTQ